MDTSDEDGTIYPGGSFLECLFLDCPEVQKVIVERDRISVVRSGAETAVSREDLEPTSRVRGYLECIPDLM